MFLKIGLEKCLYYFDFDENGNLFWKINVGKKIKKGSVAGTLNKSSGYFVVKFEGKIYQLHRILYQLYHNIELNDEFIDHINCVRSDNKKENLRICTTSQNQHNRKVYKNNKSTGIKNISIISIKNLKRNYEYYHIKIAKDGKIIYSKYFRTDLFTLEEIIKIRDEKLKIHHGEYYNLG